jgi:hypothetical protein
MICFSVVSFILILSASRQSARTIAVAFPRARACPASPRARYLTVLCPCLRPIHTIVILLNSSILLPPVVLFTS